ncbi:MAG: DUF2892 domain-containing protein [Gammaproteobacteria bacterium]|jgi:membrane-associated protease RseP (regulator of RpoE activity)
MKQNVGGIDKVIRIVIGLALISLVFVGPQTPWGWVGLLPLATAVINFCPLYPLIGFSSRKAKSA